MAKYGFDMNQMHNWGTDYEDDPENYGKNFKYRQKRAYKLDQACKLKMLISMRAVNRTSLIYAALQNINLAKEIFIADLE